MFLVEGLRFKRIPSDEKTQAFAALRLTGTTVRL